MKTLTTTVLLSVMFLSAGAFASGNRGVGPLPAVQSKPENVTVVPKTSAWPPVGNIS
ncbi:MAG: hypothetical protein IOC86_10200, partial [Aestuariivirga sp.]|nr:hypothetical protein [Aestuariivirga sp.]